MSAEQSWGADTVAFGRPREAAPVEESPRRRPPRGPRPRRRPPTTRTLALVAGVIGVVVLLTAIVGGGSGSPSSTAPIRAVADPAPRVVVKAPPTHRRRRARGEHRKPALKRQPKGQLEEGKREPKKASAKPHEQAAPEPEPAPVAEAEPEPIEEPAPEPAPVAEPPPAPTSPAAEFGM